MLMDTANTDNFDDLRRRVRLLLLLDGSERAGIAPMQVHRLHTYAYLSNVLAPVWKADVFDGRLLKRRGGPFYPALQRDLDRLVGLGLVTISDLAHIVDQDGQWRLDGAFSLNRQLAENVLTEINRLPEERNLSAFLLEVAYALSALTDSELDDLPSEDPTYADANISYGNVVDFGEWRTLNYSANAAQHFALLSDHATLGDLVHLYVRHLRRRVSGN